MVRLRDGDIVKLAKQQFGEHSASLRDAVWLKEVVVALRALKGRATADLAKKIDDFMDYYEINTLYTNGDGPDGP